MTRALTIALYVALLVCVAFCARERTEDEYRTMFQQWQAEHGRDYAPNKAQYNYRFGVFKQSVQEIDTHNEKPNQTWEAGLNEYSDMTWDEFKVHFNLGAPQNCSATNTVQVQSANGLPTHVDWREKNVVTPVKNQGRCGSCWTFSSTGALESHHAIKNKQLLSLSEQQLVDCAGAFDNHGCNGGLPSHAFEYVHYQGGIQTEDTYPYEAVDRPCRFKSDAVVVKTVRSVNITSGDENSIQTAVAEAGPVSIAYQVVSDFRFYKKGVYSSAVCKNGAMDVNHAVLVVGYDQTAEGLPYWIIKNSWSTSFGIDGYFWMLRGKNMCGIAVCSAYPEIA